MIVICITNHEHNSTLLNACAHSEVILLVCYIHVCKCVCVLSAVGKWVGGEMEHESRSTENKQRTLSVIKLHSYYAVI